MCSETLAYMQHSDMKNYLSNIVVAEHGFNTSDTKSIIGHVPEPHLVTSHASSFKGRDYFFVWLCMQMFVPGLLLV